MKRIEFVAVLVGCVGMLVLYNAKIIDGFDSTALTIGIGVAAFFALVTAWPAVEPRIRRWLGPSSVEKPRAAAVDKALASLEAERVHPPRSRLVTWCAVSALGGGVVGGVVVAGVTGSPRSNDTGGETNGRIDDVRWSVDHSVGDLSSRVSDLESKVNSLRSQVSDLESKERWR